MTLRDTDRSNATVTAKADSFLSSFSLHEEKKNRGMNIVFDVQTLRG